MQDLDQVPILDPKSSHAMFLSLRGALTMTRYGSGQLAPNHMRIREDYSKIRHENARFGKIRALFASNPRLLQGMSL